MDDQAFQLLLDSINTIKTDVRETRLDQVKMQETLLRNTISLEDHVMRTNTLQDRYDPMKTRVDELELRVKQIDRFFDILKPTPRKFILLVTAATAVLGFFTSAREFVIKVVHELWK